MKYFVPVHLLLLAVLFAVGFCQEPDQKSSNDGVVSDTTAEITKVLKHNSCKMFGK